MATVVNMHDAKNSLSRLVKRAASGEEIFIANRGKLMARLTRIRSDARSCLGTFSKARSRWLTTSILRCGELNGLPEPIELLYSAKADPRRRIH